MTLAKHGTGTEVQNTFAALFLRVAREGDLLLELPSRGEALALRAKLYSFRNAQIELAAKESRNTAPPSEELLEALRAVTLHVDGTQLHARGAMRSEAMQTLIGALGGAAAVEELAAQQVGGERKELAAAAERLFVCVAPPGGAEAGDATGNTTNPYFTRRG